MNTSVKEDGHITLEYDLYELPTAQHKAGLAGLLLMIESMKMQIPVGSPEEGTIVKVFGGADQVLNEGDPIVELG